MKTWLVLFALATGGLALAPEPGEACFRRRHQSRCVVAAPCPVCPPVAMAPPVQTVTIKGKSYRLLDTVDQGAFEERAQPDPALFNAGIASSEVFTGTDRKVPKTTILAGVPVEEFTSVTALVTDITTKMSDAKMKSSSGITRSTATRVDAEKRNVKVKGFIYAFKKEDDNDYHVILGDAPDVAPVFLNVEVSGIPVGGTVANRQALTAVRKEFKDQFGLGASGPGSYKRPHDPVPVQITGSLFWDVDHPPGAVGPGDLKPKTAWEIHPVSEIVFLDP